MSAEPKPAAAADASRRGTRLVAVLIGVTLLWYLLADRYTPYTQQARLQAFVVPVAAEVAGRVTRVEVRNNQRVRAGDLLFAVNDEQYRIAVERAQADLESTRRQIGASSAGIESALANQRAAEANELKARQDRDRLERLYREDPGTISLRRLEVSRATLVQATSQVAAAIAEVQRAREQEGGSGEDNAKLRSAASALEKARLDLRNTEIRARADGLITDLRTEVGLYAAAGSPVMTLIAIQDMWIAADFTENNLGHLKEGSPVGIVLDAMPGRVFAGRIRSIGRGVSVGQDAPAGNLPSVQNNRDWLRAAQRFPVVVEFVPGELDDFSQIRVGGQAEVMAYPTSGNPLNLLGRLFLRVMSWLSFAY
ncbi:HlyD family secretion protein [Pseudomonas schmalbachii]|uniref:HlyD family secretion protein n=1 Tax=Pseudomonas schmalbachii TaxID=2816993 RepID=A0ABS3TT62_9PSED|nr:HlyD family secretion protein [Pseudomonas schmalbachii]MBO3276861.1 HlyD family secretion protein [Pseudomonas schmalbachii]